MLGGRRQLLVAALNQIPQHCGDGLGLLRHGGDGSLLDDLRLVWGRGCRRDEDRCGKSWIGGRRVGGDGRSGIRILPSNDADDGGRQRWVGADGCLIQHAGRDFARHWNILTRHELFWENPYR